jgi:hypothetical protein
MHERLQKCGFIPINLFHDDAQKPPLELHATLIVGHKIVVVLCVTPAHDAMILQKPRLAADGVKLKELLK